MKKLACILGIALLAACGNPDIRRPWYNGPTYYKVPQCTRVSIYPNTLWKYDSTTGLHDKYITFGNTSQVICNYNPLMNRPATNMYGSIYGE